MELDGNSSVPYHTRTEFTPILLPLLYVLNIMVYLQDRAVLQVDIMKRFDISRNTLKKYAKYIREVRENTIRQEN